MFLSIAVLCHPTYVYSWGMLRTDLEHLPSPLWWRGSGKESLERMVASTGKLLGHLCSDIRCVVCVCVCACVCVCVCVRV